MKTNRRFNFRRSALQQALVSLAAVALLGVTATGARAQAVLNEATNTSLEFRAGVFALSGVDTTLRLDGSNGNIGSSVNLADALGGDTSLNVFRLDGSWLIAGPHGIEASWYDIRLKGQRKISTSINWGDQSYPVNATINSYFRTNIYKLAYGYTLHRDQKHEFTGLIGVHIMRFSTGLSIDGLGQSQNLSVTAPLPSLGVAWRARWTERFSTRASLQYFGISLESGKYSGHFTDALIAGEYRVTETAGVGVGYNRFDLSGSFKPGPLKLTVDYKYNGLMLYAFTRF
jgi:hypothetical protein